MPDGMARVTHASKNRSAHCAVWLNVGWSVLRMIERISAHFDASHLHFHACRNAWATLGMAVTYLTHHASPSSHCLFDRQTQMFEGNPNWTYLTHRADPSSGCLSACTHAQCRRWCADAVTEHTHTQACQHVRACAVKD